jgi:oligopeptide/dipeptide ABC transporter ATP-binding protein
MNLHNLNKRHAMTDPIILSARNVKKYYPVKTLGKKGLVKAVDDVSLDIVRGETFGVVGESGCGKSTLGKVLLRLEDLTEGTVIFNGQDLSGLNRAGLKTFRKQAQVIYQDPYSALNPKKKIGAVIEEPFKIHRLFTKQERQKKVVALLEKVGLHPDHRDRYPHEFSGGQRQRIITARALSVSPEFILADEPVSALDVSIQAQVINLLMDLKKEESLTYLFISHDLGVVKHICDRLAVMYLGRIVETAAVEEFFSAPLHPYSRALIAAVPVVDPRIALSAILEGDVPSPINPPDGCHFHPRCSIAGDICRRKAPRFEEKLSGRFAACHFPLINQGEAA